VLWYDVCHHITSTFLALNPSTMCESIVVTSDNVGCSLTTIPSYAEWYIWAYCCRKGESITDVFRISDEI
jgi:hypothetical protein